MIIEFRLSASADVESTARIAAWRKVPGEAIRSGEVLMEVVTEKVNVEIECDISGIVVETIGELDDEIAVGDVVARIDAPAA
jgi:pyruvate/2-oxoglutarate dehydrogenase complex dihydrolipoamide acyltransferase (E2) component